MRKLLQILRIRAGLNGNRSNGALRCQMRQVRLNVRFHTQPELTPFWHRDISESGATVAQIAAASDRMKFDRCATVEDQLRWMRDAGFANVDCSVKAWRFAVLSGRRAA
jgi:hypothetical protein